MSLDLCGCDAISHLKSISDDAEIVESVDASTLTDTIVLYSDTPLVNLDTLSAIAEFMDECEVDSAELVRGYIIGKNPKNLAKISLKSEDFIRLQDAKSYASILKSLRSRINAFHMDNGVFMADPDTVYIDYSVKIGAGTTIAPNNRLCANTIIGRNCVLESNNHLTDTIIGDEVKLTAVVSQEAIVGNATSVGPYVYLRPKANVGNNCKVGDLSKLKTLT